MKRNKITTIFQIVLEAESIQCQLAFLTLEASLYVPLPEQVALLAVLSDFLALVVGLCDPIIGPIKPHLLLQIAGQGDGLYVGRTNPMPREDVDVQLPQEV